MLYICINYIIQRDKADQYKAALKDVGEILRQNKN